MKKTMLAAFAALVLTLPAVAFELKTFPVNPGARPHDVAVGADGIVWYTAQGQGALGRLDPRNGAVRQIKLGERSAPHGVVIGPDGAPWVTDSGLNAIVRVDPRSEQVKAFPLPKGSSYANLNTLTFDKNGVVWFTGQSGFYGKADPKTGEVKIWDAPKGRGPYGIATTPSGEVWYASLAGDYIAKIDVVTGAVEVVNSPTRGAGARRVWSDSKNRLWVSLWNSGEVGLYDPQAKSWKKWKLPGNAPMAYSVYVDDQDAVWLTDFASNTIVRFDPKWEKFQSFPGRNIRQMLGRKGEVWAPESGDDRIIGIRFGA